MTATGQCWAIAQQLHVEGRECSGAIHQETLEQDADSPPHDHSKEIVEDGFQRLSVVGLEVVTLDGPLRVRAVRNWKGNVIETISVSRPELEATGCSYEATSTSNPWPCARTVK